MPLQFSFSRRSCMPVLTFRHTSTTSARQIPQHDTDQADIGGESGYEADDSNNGHRQEPDGEDSEDSESSESSESWDDDDSSDDSFDFGAVLGIGRHDGDRELAAERLRYSRQQHWRAGRARTITVGRAFAPSPPRNCERLVRTEHWVQTTQWQRRDLESNQSTWTSSQTMVE